MTAETACLFINPTAGRGRAGKCLPRIEALFADADVELYIERSLAVGDLEAKVSAAVQDGERNVVVVGGDGSIHEAVNGMLQGSNHARFGVVPAGTGNDFAKACDIPLDWQRAARELAVRIRTGETPRRIDAGRLNGRYFANGAGVGFDAKVTRIARSCRWPIGDFVYLAAILRCLVDGIASPTLAITAGEFAWRGPVTLANVANGPWIGGMFHIVPDARNDDGRFDLLVADPMSRRRLLALLPKLVRGRHVTEPEITQVSVTNLTIEAGEPVPAHLDGEVLEPATHFEIEVLPGALELL